MFSPEHCRVVRSRKEKEAVGLVLLLAHRMTHSAGSRLRAEDLTPAKYQLLVRLRSEPGLAQGELAARLGVTKGNVSMLVTQLEHAKLLTRTPDGAANQVVLTAQGLDVVDRLLPDEERWASEQFATLSTDELDQLVRLLHRLST
jgi:DNA-binding MarR family transcriptional regulator